MQGAFLFEKVRAQRDARRWSRAVRGAQEAVDPSNSFDFSGLGVQRIEKGCQPKDYHGSDGQTVRPAAIVRRHQCPLCPL
ncbi:hypothetical protein MRX96_030821 [Rhipicephalus microplus]